MLLLWEDILFDDYVLFSVDEMFGGFDDGFVLVFDSGFDDVCVMLKLVDVCLVVLIDMWLLLFVIVFD